MEPVNNALKLIAQAIEIIDSDRLEQRQCELRGLLEEAIESLTHGAS